MHLYWADMDMSYPIDVITMDRYGYFHI